MNNNEEELQRDIESGVTPEADDLDVRAYREVFARLGKHPDINLSTDFADKVVLRIVERQKRSSARDFYWLAFGIFLLISAVVVATVMSGFKPTLGFLGGISAYAGVFVFGATFILLLNRLEKRILSRTE